MLCGAALGAGFGLFEEQCQADDFVPYAVKSRAAWNRNFSRIAIAGSSDIPDRLR